MRAGILATMLLVAVPLALPGCGKKGPQGPSAYDVSGVKLDVPKFQQAFETAGDDVKPVAAEAVSHIRYGQYAEALMSLDKLANNPALSEPQKKAVNDVIEQMKQVISKAGPSR